MIDNYTVNEQKELEKKVEELQKKLKETEDRLNELNRALENKVIDRTVEVNKLLRNKIRFIDNLSHDLGTPLTPLISLLPIIKENITDVKSKEMLDTCIRNAEYIRRVVNNTREIAELSSTDILLKKENLFAIVDQLIKKYESIFKTCRIDIKNNIGQDVVIKTERDRLMQLFDHIASNAVNSMIDKGEGSLIFESKPIKKRDGTFIQVSITDTGVGLTREQIDHIFDEFYKTDDSRHKLDSTGLGLSICKNIIEKHGGRIWADSRGKGTGTTVYFTVPSEDVIFDRSF